MRPWLKWLFFAFGLWAALTMQTIVVFLVLNFIPQAGLSSWGLQDMAFYNAFMVWVNIGFYLSFVMTVLALVHVLAARKVPPNRRALWIALLFFSCGWGMMFYWYFYIWRDVPTLPVTPPSAPPPGEMTPRLK